MSRRTFSREPKIEAVLLVMDRGFAVAQAARDLDVAESVLRRWMREMIATPAAAFPGNGQMRPDLAEIAALKKEVARLWAARYILKEVAAFCRARGDMLRSSTALSADTTAQNGSCVAAARSPNRPLK